MSESSKPQENLPRELPPNPLDVPSPEAPTQISDGAERLENEDLIEQATGYEELREVERKTSRKEVLARLFIASVFFLFFLAIITILIFFIHHLTPWGWLSPDQFKFVDELSKYLALAIGFFTVGRKYELVGNILEKLAED